MGYLGGLLDTFSGYENYKLIFLQLISKKNIHDLKKLANDHSLPQESVNTAIAIMSPAKNNEDVISQADKLALNEQMHDAVTELKNIYSILMKLNLDKYIRIDLSVTGDPGYYNGILMHGYVHGVSREILSGGRYDMLMNKMGKKGAHAMGFAIYFDALDRELHVKNKKSPESYIIYNGDSDPDTLIEMANSLKQRGISYSALTCLPEDVSNVTVYTVCGTDIKETKV